MKAFIPPELLDLVPLPVVIVLEQITDVTRMEMTAYPDDPDRIGIGHARQLAFSGSKFETFLALIQAGAKPSWSVHGVDGWSVCFYAELPRGMAQ